jgi:hypothetical protein
MSSKRAHETLADSALQITDVVAVVGVVGISSCEASVTERVNHHPMTFPLLKRMMDAGRFVFLLLPYDGDNN